jgi:hypothetical protein
MHKAVNSVDAAATRLAQGLLSTVARLGQGALGSLCIMNVSASHQEVGRYNGRTDSLYYVKFSFYHQGTVAPRAYDYEKTMAR